MRATTLFLFIASTLILAGCNDSKKIIEFNDPEHIEEVMGKVGLDLNAQKFDVSKGYTGEGDSLIERFIVEYHLDNDTTVSFKQIDSLIGLKSKYLAQELYDGVVDKEEFDSYLFTYFFLHTVKTKMGKFDVEIDNRSFEFTVEEITSQEFKEN